MGDAELDEGNVWEAVFEERVQGLGNVLWIIDLNRQSLDRVIPGIRAAQLKSLFPASGWQVLEGKYGRRLKAAFERPGGEALRQRIDEMSNAEYQSLIRCARRGAAPPPGRRARRRPAGVSLAVEDIPDDDLPRRCWPTLGGHDMPRLLEVFAEAEAVADAPVVVFAYTIKGWGLPIAGDPLNHSALLTEDPDGRAARAPGRGRGASGTASPPTPEGRSVRGAAARLSAASTAIAPPLAARPVPDRLGRHHPADDRDPGGAGRR